MIKRFLVLCVLSFAVLTTANAAEVKIGFVNVPRVLEKAPQADKAKKDLEKEFSPRDKRLLAEKKKIKKLQDKLKRDAAVMSEDERRKLERDIMSKSRDVKRTQDEFREDFNIRRNEELGKLQKKVYEAIKRLAKKEKYDLLLTEGVVYASSAVDVTKKVQDQLASMYRSK
jgi:outer membrane protein